MKDAQHTPIVERLRGSAKAFRKHPVYSSDGDGVLLTTQADECEEAADIITDLLEALNPFVESHAHTMFFLSRKEVMHRDGRNLYTEDVDRARTAISRARNGGE